MSRTTFTAILPAASGTESWRSYIQHNAPQLARLVSALLAAQFAAGCLKNCPWLNQPVHTSKKVPISKQGQEKMSWLHRLDLSPKQKRRTFFQNVEELLMEITEDGTFRQQPSEECRWPGSIPTPCHMACRETFRYLARRANMACTVTHNWQHSCLNIFPPT